MRRTYGVVCALVLSLLALNLYAHVAVVSLSDGTNVEGTLKVLRKNSVSIETTDGEQKVYTSKDVLSFQVNEFSDTYRFPLVYRTLPEALQALYKVDVVYSSDYQEVSVDRNDPFTKTPDGSIRLKPKHSLFGASYLNYTDYFYLMVGGNAGWGMHFSNDVNDQFANAILNPGLWDATIKANIGYQNLFQCEVRRIFRLASLEVETNNIYMDSESKSLHLDETQFVFKLAPWAGSMSSFHTLFAYYGMGISESMVFADKNDVEPSNYHWKDGNSFCVGLEYVVIDKFSKQSESPWGYSLALNLEYDSITYKAIGIGGGEMDMETTISGVRMGFSANVGFVSGR